MEKMKYFCASKDEEREYLHEPMRYGTHALCSNGVIAVAFKNEAKKLQNPPPKKVSRFITKLTCLCTYDHNPTQIPDIAIENCTNCEGTRKSHCHECQGRGRLEAESSYHCYSVDCKSCEQKINNWCRDCDGYGIEKTSILINGNIILNYRYIDLCKTHLLNPQFFIADEKTPIKIVHDEGFGFLMPMHRSHDRHIRVDT